MLSRVTLGENCMVVPSDVAEAMNVFEREMYKLKKLTEPGEIAAQERVCITKARELATIGNHEPVTATDEQFLEFVREIRAKMDIDPAWQEEADD